MVEIIFVVAIIGVLAAIAIPAFTSEGNKGKATSEIVAWFAELHQKEEQFKVDNNIYHPATTACPATLTGQARSMLGCVASGQPWGPDEVGPPIVKHLKVRVPTNEAYCRYTITTGLGAVAGAVVNPSGFTFSNPLGPWYYILGECDMDADGSLATYFSSSIDSSIQKQNEGE